MDAAEAVQNLSKWSNDKVFGMSEIVTQKHLSERKACSRNQKHTSRLIKLAKTADNLNETYEQKKR